MKILFMGTPDFSVAPLNALLESGHEICGVFTQPDKVNGRGGKVKFCPVKALALTKNIPIFQPKKLREKENVEIIGQLKPDIMIVVAYGQILPKDILEIPPLGCLNIHASLLPDYRGAAPIQWAILNGEEKSGVTIMQMDEGLDTGDILAQSEVLLSPKETAESLHALLSQKGADLLVDTLNHLEQRQAQRQVQKEPTTEYASVLKKEMGLIDWNQSAKEIERKIRAFNPWPGSFTFLSGKMLKIWDSTVEEQSERQEDKQAGEILEIMQDGFLVQTKENALWVESVQLEGKKRMPVSDFLRGCVLNKGVVLGQEEKEDKDVYC